MSATTHLGITLVEQSQSQKEVTVNAALTRIDALLNTGAISRTTATPPGSPASGDLYIVGASATGAWVGQAGMITYFDQIWKFMTPRAGVTLWVNDESLIYTYNGSSWIAASTSKINAQTGTTYTVAASDLDKIVECSNAAAITVTLPKSLPVGFNFSVVQTGAGQVTITPASGANRRNFDGFTKTAGQYAVLNFYVSTNAGGAAAVYIMQGMGV